MNAMLILLVAVAMVAGSAAVLAAALLVRDLTRPDPALDRRLNLAASGTDLSMLALPGDWSAGRIDRFFYALVEGSGSKLDSTTALALVAGLAVVGCAIPLVLLENPLAGAAGLVLGVAVPLLWWTWRRSRRIRAMQRHLPETLELLADALRAGQTLELATRLVAQQAPAPLNEEFSYCARQLSLGHAPLAVLDRLSRRIPLPEFRIFAVAVLVHRRTGGNLSLLTERLATSARDRQELHGHLRATTIASRLSVVGMTVGPFAAAALLGGIRPDYFQAFLRHPLGPTLLATALGLQLLGLFWVWRILRVRF